MRKGAERGSFWCRGVLGAGRPGDRALGAGAGTEHNAGARLGHPSRGSSGKAGPGLSALEARGQLGSDLGYKDTRHTGRRGLEARPALELGTLAARGQPPTWGARLRGGQQRPTPHQFHGA